MIEIQIPAEIEALIAAGALFVLNDSGGKDSQAMKALLRRRIPAAQLLVVHAHLAGEEWQGVEDHVRATSGELEVVIAEPVKTFAEMVERRGMFPSPQQRQCTSDLKRGPINREIRRYLKANPRFGGLVVSCQGLRGQESTDRAKLAAFKRNERESLEPGKRSGAGRSWFDWLPIHDLTTDEVFQVIADAGQRPHWAYAAGMTRLSCMFCIMASRADLRLAAELNPEAYRERVLLERRIGHTINMEGRTLEDVTGIRIAEPGELVIGADVAGDDQGELIEAIAFEAANDDQGEREPSLPIVYVVSCTKSKASRPSAARDLYAPSDWFTKARAYVEAQGAPWFILSAEHGLLEPDQVVAPYETTLLRMDRADRQAWAGRVHDQLARRRLIGRAQIVLLAGAAYREFLEPWLTSEGRRPELAAVPMRGLGLGEQKAWLARRTPREAEHPPDQLAA